MRTKRSNHAYLEKAATIHGDKYDLSSITYEGHNKKITVRCRQHGLFTIRASNFLQGVGCRICGSETSAEKQRLSVESFAKKAKSVHGTQYDYSLVVYQSTHQHVKIICQAHGVFEQLPSNHLRGKGCPKCGLEKNGESQRRSIDEFVQSARSRHGNKYDYSQVQYRDARTKVQIVCGIHGAFFQTPNKHCDVGQGCPRCANRDMNLEKFVQRALLVHRNSYLYENAHYSGARKPIVITCRIHGDFSQRADHHLRGVGCPLCIDALNSRGVRKIEQWLVAQGVDFAREVDLNSLRNAEQKNRRRGLRFDFWLPIESTAIEFDGRQHFEAVAKWGGELALKKQKNNDAKKEKWARKYGFQMIRIRYDQEEEIDTILKTALHKAQG